MRIAIDFNPVSVEPDAYGRYPVVIGDGVVLELGMAYFTHPPGARKEGWFDSDGWGARPVNVSAWTSNHIVLI